MYNLYVCRLLVDNLVVRKGTFSTTYKNVRKSISFLLYYKAGQQLGVSRSCNICDLLRSLSNIGRTSSKKYHYVQKGLKFQYFYPFCTTMKKHTKVSVYVSVQSVLPIHNSTESICCICRFISHIINKVTNTLHDVTYISYQIASIILNVSNPPTTEAPSVILAAVPTGMPTIVALATVLLVASVIPTLCRLSQSLCKGRHI